MLAKKCTTHTNLLDSFFCLAPMKVFRFSFSSLAITLYLLLVLECLQIFSVASFLMPLPPWKRLIVLIVASCPLVFVGMVFAVVQFAVLYRFLKNSSSQILSAFYILPSGILALTYLLLVDRLCYTVFAFGIVTAQGVWLFPWFLLFFGLLRFSWVMLKSFESLLVRRDIVVAVISIWMLSFFISLLSSGKQEFRDPKLKVSTRDIKNFPDIILIASDGVSAAHTSVYGYQRKTTPFLDEQLDDMLIAENAWMNSCTTSGSVPAMLSGKLPTTTRMNYYTTDIYKGNHQFQHLPGILKSYGYHTVEIGVRYAVDQYDINMRAGFDKINQRSRQLFDHDVYPLSFVASQPEASFFLLYLYDKIVVRFAHIIGLRQMHDFWSEVNRFVEPRYTDSDRMEELYEILKAETRPIFAHVHLMGTHGQRFYPSTQRFSKDKLQTDAFMIDFYDDAVADFDHYLKELFRMLAKNGRINRTVVVISSDHGIQWSCARTPLLFRFPGANPSGRISENVQHIDVAPTLLDYLDLDIPEWMEGASMFVTERDKTRPIFFVAKATATSWHPLYNNISQMGLLVCHRYYLLDLEEDALTVSDLENHSAPCEEEKLPNKDEAKQLIYKHLRSANYF